MALSDSAAPGTGSFPAFTILRRRRGFFGFTIGQGLAIGSKYMNVMFGLFNLGGGEIILILALVLILFGAKKLPELAKGLGTGIKEFKKATRDVTDEMHTAMDEPPPPPPKSLPANTGPTQPEAQQTVPQSTPGTKA